MSTPADGTVMVRCFHGGGARGNLHRVILPSEDGWTAPQAAALSVRIAPTIVVLMKQKAGHSSDENSCSLAFFCNGVVITRCGSGSLAAARALMDSDSSARAPLNFLTAGGLVRVVSDGFDLGYKIRPLPYFRDNSRARWQGVIDRKLRHLVLVGTDNDYCLLELHSQSALEQCSINARRLSLMSKRALIVTAKSHNSLHDYALRYFSPQYGQHEDGATGSAHAMAAAYWQHRFSSRCIRGAQRSAAGGEFRVQRSGLEQCVYGRAEIDVRV